MYKIAYLSKRKCVNLVKCLGESADRPQYHRLYRCFETVLIRTPGLF